MYCWADLDAGSDAVMLGVRVQHGILGVGGTAPDVAGKDADPGLLSFREQFFVLRDNHNGRLPDRGVGVLVGGCLEASRDHQTDMDMARVLNKGPTPASQTRGGV